MASDATRRGRLGVLVDEMQSSGRDFFPMADTLEAMRVTWTRVRSESQVRQSVQAAPDNAGPLNSAALVHRSIAIMRELSPRYLQHFLSYVDDLSSLEQLLASASTRTTPTGPATPPPSVRKRAKAKPRTS